MLKRVASAIFLLSFAISSVGRIMDRTEAWAAQHVYRFKHLSPNQTGQSTAEVHKLDKREKQTRLLEDGSVLHVSFLRSSFTPPAADAFARTLTGFVAHLNSRPLSSRAPPTLLFI
jgi:hypothetical protein